MKEQTFDQKEKLKDAKNFTHKKKTLQKAEIKKNSILTADLNFHNIFYEHKFA